MARPKYSVQLEGAKVYIREARISPKDSAEIAREIKGMPISQAKGLLRKVIGKEKAIPYRRHYKKVPHRKGKGWKSGKYPVVRPYLHFIKISVTLFQKTRLTIVANAAPFKPYIGLGINDA